LGTKVTDLFGIEKVLAENALKRVDLYLGDGDELEIGDITLKAMETKGHTRDHMAILAGDRIFTGDVLIIGQCGRTDLPGGSSRDMYESLFGRIMPLSDDLIVYPAHDYRGNINSSLGYEKVNNVASRTPPPWRSSRLPERSLPPARREDGKTPVRPQHHGTGTRG
jgi:glyoxylase-like metal-dependent hydrolase (beta-lactamase superfamily II)